MDGSVLMAALEAGEAPRAAEAIVDGREPKSASEEEAEAIRARLERLGYL